MRRCIPLPYTPYGCGSAPCLAKNCGASKEIKTWIATNLPGTLVEPLAPSECSGWISGYFGDLRIDFSEDGLKQFRARWETPDGASIDDRFQCYLMPYQAWFEKHGRYEPSNLPPSTIGYAVWVDTPIGFIHHQLASEEDACRCPAKPADIWMQAVRLWPELKEVNFDKLPYGNITKTPDKNSWVVWYSDLPLGGIEFTVDRKAAFRQWFKLPADVAILNEWG